MMFQKGVCGKEDETSANKTTNDFHKIGEEPFSGGLLKDMENGTI
jgi:hypothetical protein